MGATKHQRDAILLWLVWMGRNHKVFKGRTTPNEVLLARVDRTVVEQPLYFPCVYKSLVPRNSASAHKWLPPPSGAVKINASLAFEG